MVSLFTSFIFGRFGKYFIAVTAVLAVLGSVYYAGTYLEKKDQRIKELEAFKKTSTAISKVDPIVGRDDAVKFLQRRGLIRGSDL